MLKSIIYKLSLLTALSVLTPSDAMINEDGNVASSSTATVAKSKITNLTKAAVLAIENPTLILGGASPMDDLAKRHINKPHVLLDRQKTMEEVVPFLKLDLENLDDLNELALNFPNKFPVICFDWSVVAHINWSQAHLEAIKGALKPGGKFYIPLPVRGNRALFHDTKFYDTVPQSAGSDGPRHTVDSPDRTAMYQVLLGDFFDTNTEETQRAALSQLDAFLIREDELHATNQLPIRAIWGWGAGLPYNYKPYANVPNFNQKFADLKKHFDIEGDFAKRLVNISKARIATTLEAAFGKENVTLLEEMSTREYPDLAFEFYNSQMKNQPIFVYTKPE